MIRMVQSVSAKHAKDYFSDALLKSDYYLEDQEIGGAFRGRLAGRLGISGAVTKESFFALCDNRHPGTGQPLTPRTKEERTTGYDINFHCPKSVSIVHMLSGDNHILEAFQKSITETMNELETSCQVRVRKGGKAMDRDSGELVYADFIHQTARPVDGHDPDPHLHAHCYVFNATWDGTEQRIKAGQFREINRNMPYYQALFHKKLSDNLIGLGYAIRPTAKSFEIEHVPKEVIALFSKRTNEIGKVAREKGITDAKALDELGARTRAKKATGISMLKLKENWRRQIQALHLPDEKQKESPVRYAVQKEPLKTVTPEQCIDHALGHLFERASVMPYNKLLAGAYKYGIGAAGVTAEAIARQLKNEPRLIKVKEGTRTLCTTKDVLQEEQQMVELAVKGKGAVAPLYKQLPDMNLEGQQQAAVAHILTTADRVSIVRGAAGTGKTTLLREAVKQIEHSGKTVTLLAPTAQASRGVLREEGFESAETVALFLNDPRRHEAITGQVLWVDEAGLLGTGDTLRLLQVATERNARLVLGGDTRQHASVARGDALRILNTVGGIKTAEVSKIYRQQDAAYRQAVQALSRGDIRAGFEQLDKLGAICDVDPLTLNEQLADDYLKVIKQGKSALVITPTHLQKDEVTRAIREKMQVAKLLGKKEIDAEKLFSLNFTVAQKSDSRNYRNGHFICFNQNVPGIRRGSLWQVADVKEQQVYLTDKDGGLARLPEGKPDAYDVFEKSVIRVAKGDKIRLTRNGFDSNRKRLNNGQIFDVVAVNKKGAIRLRQPGGKQTYEIDKAFGHIDHAHCLTSYASQGKTTDEVLIAQPAATFPATDARQFYVSVSRGREKVTIYTDDKATLLVHAAESGNRASALELTSMQRHADYVADRQRGKNIHPEIDTGKKPWSPVEDFIDKEPDYGPEI